MTFLHAKFCMPALAIALFMMPAASFAQGYDGVMGAQPNYKGGNATGGLEENTGESQDVEGEAAENGVGGFGGGTGFDEMYAGSEGAGKDLYSYVGNEKSNPANKRDKAAAESRKKRDDMVAKMKANSEKLLKQQKERAWKAANRGKEYPGEEETSDDDAGYGDDGGDSGDAMFGKENGGGDPFGDGGDAGGGDSGDSSDGGGESSDY